MRGTLSLPAGTGRSERVAVFAAGEQAAEARAAGADVVGADDLVAKINGGFLDFDVAIATPDLMGQVGTLGRVLGPRGLMPNPKTGTVTTDVGKAVTEFKGGRVEYRTDKVGNIHVPVGKASFTKAQLLDNIHAVLDELQRAKPAVGQGPYLRTITLSSTMSPGVHVDPARARDEKRSRSWLRPERAARPEGPVTRSNVARFSPWRQHRSPNAEDLRCTAVPKGPIRARLTRRHFDRALSAGSGVAHRRTRPRMPGGTVPVEAAMETRERRRSPSSTRCGSASGTPSASVVTEYRGLTVAELAELRKNLAGVGRRLQDLQEHAGAAGHRRQRARGRSKPC